MTSLTATAAKMQQLTAWPAACLATVISDKQDVVDPVRVNKTLAQNWLL
jgi:hypothetical protein